MPHSSIVLALVLLAQARDEPLENPVDREIRAEGLVVNGTTVRLPDPTLVAGHDREAAQAALKAVAGDDRAARELLKDSITAPFILKTRDVKAGDATVRVVDLWFVVHADLQEVDLDQALRPGGDQAFEAGNMKFESKTLGEKDFAESKRVALAPIDGRKEWFTHSKGRLLDRIVVESTDRTVATRTSNSLRIASKTDHGFDADPRFPNRWSSLTRQGAEETVGAPHVYPGSISSVQITKLTGESDALLVESHLAFVEPLDWFQGNPILRSKIGVIAQDQIRRLRREIQKKRNEAKKPG